jgi:hypothetical protein
MIPRKRILYSICCIILGIMVGTCGTYYFLSKRKSIEIKENIFTMKYIQTITLIRLSEALKNGEVDAAGYGLEESLDSNIIFITTDAYEKTKTGEIARETIQMAARHRGKYPFKANTPCINKLIENAFLVTAWDGYSPRPKQIQWNE